MSRQIGERQLLFSVFPFSSGGSGGGSDGMFFFFVELSFIINL